MIYIKNCKICGKEFETNNDRQVCCCKECSRQNNKNLSMESKRRCRKNGKRKKKNPEEVDSLTAKCMKVEELGLKSYGQLQQQETWDWIRAAGYGIGGEW